VVNRPHAFLRHARAVNYTLHAVERVPEIWHLAMLTLRQIDPAKKRDCTLGGTPRSDKYRTSLN
jgi:hypothetical protein